MLGQASFSDLEYANKKRRTRRELFLAEMDAVVPWPELLAVVEPHYPRAGGRGRPPVGLAAMLRIYFLQQWFALSDRQMEDGLYDIESLRRFAGFSNITAALPDETTILNFRHLLEQHDLTTRLLEVVNGLLKAKAKPKGSLGAALSGSQKKRNRRNSGIRARVEHLFRIVKRQFGYTKVRYRGLAKNAAQVMVLIGLANLYALRRRLVTA